MSDTPTAASLASTDLIDSAHPSVVAFARECAVGSTDRERAVALHDAVRDGFRYDPYRVDLSPDARRRLLEPVVSPECAVAPAGACRKPRCWQRLAAPWASRLGWAMPTCATT